MLEAVAACLALMAQGSVGKQKWHDGVYEGEFAYDERHGAGTFRWLKSRPLSRTVDSLRHMRRQPPSHAATASVACGDSLRHMRRQPPSHAVTASVTYGDSLSSHTVTASVTCGDSLCHRVSQLP